MYIIVNNTTIVNVANVLYARKFNPSVGVFVIRLECESLRCDLQYTTGDDMDRWFRHIMGAISTGVLTTNVTADDAVITSTAGGSGGA